MPSGLSGASPDGRDGQARRAARAAARVLSPQFDVGVPLRDVQAIASTLARQREKNAWAHLPYSLTEASAGAAKTARQEYSMTDPEQRTSESARTRARRMRMVLLTDRALSFRLDTSRCLPPEIGNAIDEMARQQNARADREAVMTWAAEMESG